MSAEAPKTNDLYSAGPTPLIERLARIEGQSNFLSLLAGIEAGPDTTQDMAALAFARGRGAGPQEPHGAVPEVLEAHVARSELFRRPLMSMVWRGIREEFGPQEREWRWIQGAIADAFLLIQCGECKPIKVRAKRFRVDEAAFGAMRKLAYGVFLSLIHRTEREYIRAMRSTRETPGNRYAENEIGETFSELARRGSYKSAPRRLSDESDDPFLEDEDSCKPRGMQPGVADRLGWDDRNAAPGPVTELQAQPPPPR